MVATAVISLTLGMIIVAKLLWTLYLSPLAKQRIPGPKLAAVSDVWHYWLQVRRRRTLTFHDLFERYGPVVRAGPNRVIFRNIDALKTIYSTHSFRKSNWYGALAFGGAHNMLSTGDPAYHARCRRLSAPTFRGENLRAAGYLLLQEMEELVGRLRRDCADGRYVDALQLFPQLTLDILGLSVLGVRFNQIATGQAHVFQKHLQSMLIDKLLIRPLPSIIRKLPIPQLQDIVSAEAIVIKYVENLYEQIDEKSSEERSSMLAAYKTYREAETGEPAPLPLVVSDLCVMIIAGMESSALSILYTAYGLAAHEKMWEAIRAEISTVDFGAEDFVDTLRGLPYLNAFTREVLRVTGPGPIFLERLVPAGGATLDGYFLPEGTEVGGQAYSSHLDERIFPHPHTIDPLRWVQLDKISGQYFNREDVTQAMNDNYFPFGVGVRSCAGKGLADVELALATATIVKNFRIHLHETTTPDSMRPVELTTMRPRAGRCLLRFEYFPITAM